MAAAWPYGSPWAPSSSGWQQTAAAAGHCLGNGEMWPPPCPPARPRAMTPPMVFRQTPAASPQLSWAPPGRGSPRSPEWQSAASPRLPVAPPAPQMSTSVPQSPAMWSREPGWPTVQSPTFRSREPAPSSLLPPAGTAFSAPQSTVPAASPGAQCRGIDTPRPAQAALTPRMPCRQETLPPSRRPYENEMAMPSLPLPSASPHATPRTVARAISPVPEAVLVVSRQPQEMGSPRPRLVSATRQPLLESTSPRPRLISVTTRQPEVSSPRPAAAAVTTRMVSAPPAAAYAAAPSPRRAQDHGSGPEVEQVLQSLHKTLGLPGPDSSFHGAKMRQDSIFCPDSLARGSRLDSAWSASWRGSMCSNFSEACDLRSTVAGYPAPRPSQSRDRRYSLYHHSDIHKKAAAGELLGLLGEAFERRGTTFVPCAYPVPQPTADRARSDRRYSLYHYSDHHKKMADR
eukprot:TRINITY_DN32809_c0_g1_i1.p1 TRINITY_DN32809_c0_g1~~TRINITY_DN32809_c0_g1_i1.p1  ORF type:complete len:458 (-),score=56.31 TRINITY_DN32809_c0_g1_i1:615-1988(-)